MNTSLELLKNRARQLAIARQFFDSRGILEVDCGALMKRAPIDTNIDVISAQISDTQEAFLHTSPEYAMKRCLSQGAPDIYFLGHVFRKNEKGKRHSPEFTMVEWYRIKIPFQEMIQETCDFLFLFLGTLPIEILSYKEAFQKYSKTIPLNPAWSKKTERHYILSHFIEPNLGQNCLTVLIDYPPEEAALACLTQKNGEFVAERFEIYHKGVELANGYHECTNGKELRDRFEKENEQRKTRGQEPYVLDEDFLTAVTKIPDCCGVSVGFDRAFMLQQKEETLTNVIL